MCADFVTRDGLAGCFQPIGKLILGESKSLTGFFKIDSMHVTNRYIAGEACQEEAIRSARMLRSPSHAPFQTPSSIQTLR